MTDTNFLKMTDFDLEDGLNSNKQKKSININYKNTTDNKSIFSCCMRTFLWFIIMIVSFPLAFCDLYYGYNDHSCVSESVGKLAINLKDYLLINGWINIGILIVLTIGLCFTNIDSLDKIINNNCFVCCGGLTIIIFTIINIFSIMLNVFGAIIFWSLMDTSNCDRGIYNYVFTSLIIKLCFNTIAIFQRKEDNE